jgi:ATP phosphoribosyltransferase
LNGITLALSKGRIFEETLPLLAAAGITPTDNPETSRKLIIGTNRPDVRLVIVRATDTPTYVQYGAADMGIAGKDTLIEHGGAGLYQPLDLNIAKCRLCVAVRKDFDYAAAVKRGARIRVATKYVKAAREHFRSQGRARRSHQAVRLNGAGPAGRAGRRDCRSRLHRQHAQGQQPDRGVEDIMPISSRLVVNQASLKLKRELIQPVLEAFAGAIKP